MPIAGVIRVIPPGYEELFGQMFGKGETFPGGCKLTDGKIDRTVARGTFGCENGEVILELRHPDVALQGTPAAPLRQTERFELRVVSGSPPAEFIEAIEAKIRGGEVRFEWSDVTSEETQPRRGSAIRVLLGVVVVLTLIVVVWIVVRRRSAH